MALHKICQVIGSNLTSLIWAYYRPDVMKCHLIKCSWENRTYKRLASLTGSMLSRVKCIQVRKEAALFLLFSGSVIFIPWGRLFSIFFFIVVGLGKVSRGMRIWHQMKNYSPGFKREREIRTRRRKKRLFFSVWCIVVDPILNPHLPLSRLSPRFSLFCI